MKYDCRCVRFYFSRTSTQSLPITSLDCWNTGTVECWGIQAHGGPRASVPVAQAPPLKLRRPGRPAPFPFGEGGRIDRLDGEVARRAAEVGFS
jgi:hypothetical protein